MKRASIEIRSDVFIDAIPVSEDQHQRDQQAKDDDPSEILAVTLQAFSSVSVADAGGVGHLSVVSGEL
jgi:hypothetical protein